MPSEAVIIISYLYKRSGGESTLENIFIRTIHNEYHYLFVSGRSFSIIPYHVNLFFAK